MAGHSFTLTSAQDQQSGGERGGWEERAAALESDPEAFAAAYRDALEALGELPEPEQDNAFSIGTQRAAEKGLRGARWQTILAAEHIRTRPPATPRAPRPLTAREAREELAELKPDEAQSLRAQAQAERRAEGLAPDEDAEMVRAAEILGELNRRSWHDLRAGAS